MGSDLESCGWWQRGGIVEEGAKVWFPDLPPLTLMARIACSAGAVGDVGFDPWVGRSSEEDMAATQYSLLKNPMDRGAWMATVLQGWTGPWQWEQRVITTGLQGASLGDAVDTDLNSGVLSRSLQSMNCLTQISVWIIRQEFWGGVPFPLPLSGMSSQLRDYCLHLLESPAIGRQEFFTTEPAWRLQQKMPWLQRKKGGSGYYGASQRKSSVRAKLRSGSLGFLKVAEVNRDGEYEIFLGDFGADKGAEAGVHWKWGSELLPTAGRAQKFSHSDGDFRGWPLKCSGTQGSWGLWHSQLMQWDLRSRWREVLDGLLSQHGQNCFSPSQINKCNLCFPWSSLLGAHLSLYTAQRAGSMDFSSIRRWRYQTT